MRLCLLLFWLVAAPGARAAEVVVFAAASLRTALEEVADAWDTATGHEMTVAPAGSSALARQIQQGAPADIFISANPGWMDALEAEGRLAPGTRADLLTNRLELVGHGPGAPLDLAALPEALGRGRLAMALVDAVPAGIYGKAALQHAGIWEEIAPQVAQADNVRAALALVAAGAAPFGIVYATDAAVESRVTVRATFSEASHPPIVYPIAAVAGRLTPEVADALAYLQGPEAQKIFEANGFGWAR